MVSLLDGTLISPFSHITKARFGGWSVKLIRDDGVVLTPTTVPSVGSGIWFQIFDQDNIRRILGRYEDGVLIDENALGIQNRGKDFKFNTNTDRWSFNFSDVYTDGWKPSDSPLGFKLIVFTINLSTGGLLNPASIDTQMAKEGNGGPKRRLNDSSGIGGIYGENIDNLIKVGTYDLAMPIWRFRGPLGSIDVDDPVINEPLGIEDSDGGTTEWLGGGVPNKIGSYTSGTYFESSIPYELTYRISDFTANDPDGPFGVSYLTDQNEDIPNGSQNLSLIKTKAGHLGQPIYRSIKATSESQDITLFQFETDSPNSLRVDEALGSGILIRIGPHTFSPKNHDEPIS